MIIMYKIDQILTQPFFILISLVLIMVRSMEMDAIGIVSLRCVVIIYYKAEKIVMTEIRYGYNII